MHQIHESIETEMFADAILQVQQQELEHQTIYQNEDDDIGYMPGLIDEGTEGLLGQEIYKAQFIES
jgi:hypothetical protein